MTSRLRLFRRLALAGVLLTLVVVVLGAWVRLHYVYPYPHVDQVIPLMAKGLILPYLDIPFQHASPTVLKAMKRPANQVKVLERIPAEASGFAGEKEKVTKELLSQKQSQAWQAWVDRARSGAKVDVSPRLTSRRG